MVDLSSEEDLQKKFRFDYAKLQLLEKDTEKSEFVRVGVESGGCSGLSYKLEFDGQKNLDDEMIEDNGIKLLINKYTANFLNKFENFLNN